MKKDSSQDNTVLGVDLGANSVGWAMLAIGGKEATPTGVVGTGVRVFEAGVEGTEADIRMGKDESRAAERRKARLGRRQTERRARRMARLFRLLQEAGLLPEGPSLTGEDRDRIIRDLDRKVRTGLGIDSDPKKAHLLPYLLRRRALDERLEPYELGRALYHLRRAKISDGLRAGLCHGI